MSSSGKRGVIALGLAAGVTSLGIISPLIYAFLNDRDAGELQLDMERSKWFNFNKSEKKKCLRENKKNEG